MHLAFESAVAQFGQHIEQTHEIARIVLDLLPQGGGVEVGPELADVGGGKLEDGFVKFAGVLLPEDVQRELLPGAGALPEQMLLKPLLVAAFSPMLEIVIGEPLSGFAQLLDDSGVRDAIANHLVDGLPRFVGETRDFASMLAVRQLVDRGRVDG